MILLRAEAESSPCFRSHAENETHELTSLIAQRTRLSTEIMRVTKQLPQLSNLRKRRTELIKQLDEVRTEVMTRRKAQLSEINENLRATVRDFSIYLYYRSEGIIEEFTELILDVMQGTYFQEESARAFCFQILPAELAEIVRKNQMAALATKGLEVRWAMEIINRFKTLTRLHELEVLWKQPCPVSKVLTKTSPQREIPIGQLSDGQKHTILLTIAMLAKSSAPLLIDQPEDDLDNEFISTSVVRTLRSVKERRQIILVTHNSNIAVLGDSELILPLKRVGDSGEVSSPGSIDRTETKDAVLHVLEGGENAFKRRMTIYGY
jgi:DNA repair exonuclease SbcCD ATPase subunit